MKETLDLKTVESYFEHIKLFIIDLMVCIDNIEAIIKAKDENLNLRPIQDFIGHYVYLSYSHASINIYKIYKPEEKRSFQKLFNKFKNFRYCEELRNLFNENSYSDDKNLISNKLGLLNAVEDLENKIAEHSTLITKINLRRQTFYAHTDPDVEIKSESLLDLKEIIELSVKIYNDLYGKLFGRYFMFYSHTAIINPIIDDRKFVDSYWSNEEDKLK